MNPNPTLTGGYGYHLTHLLSEFALLGGLLGALWLLGAFGTFLGPFAGLAQLATACVGLGGMTYGHVAFTASMSGVSYTK